MSLKSWFEKKSKEKSQANIKAILTAIIALTKEHKVDGDALLSLQNRLMTEFFGPIPLEEVKTSIIEPILTRNDVPKIANDAIVKCYDYFKTHHGDDPPARDGLQAFFAGFSDFKTKHNA